MDDTKDFGTPSANSEKLVTLNIDGVDVTVPEGTSLMRAASVAGFVCLNYVQQTVSSRLVHAVFVW